VTIIIALNSTFGAMFSSIESEEGSSDSVYACAEAQALPVMLVPCLDVWSRRKAPPTLSVHVLASTSSLCGVGAIFCWSNYGMVMCTLSLACLVDDDAPLVLS
jgi:hypothetical protein